MSPELRAARNAAGRLREHVLGLPEGPERNGLLLSVCQVEKALETPEERAETARRMEIIFARDEARARGVPEAELPQIVKNS